MGIFMLQMLVQPSVKRASLMFCLYKWEDLGNNPETWELQGFDCNLRSQLTYADYRNSGRRKDL